LLRSGLASEELKFPFGFVVLVHQKSQGGIHTILQVPALFILGNDKLALA
jgi:hypothetical protein